MDGYGEYIITTFVKWLPALVVSIPALVLYGWHLRLQGRRNEALQQLADVERRLLQVEETITTLGEGIDKLTDDQRFIMRLLVEREAKPSMIKGE